MSVRLNTRNFDEEGSFRRHSWIFSGGSRVEQINKQSPITPLVNSFSTLLYGRNYLKNYENIFGNIGYTKFFESGVKLQLNATYEDRIPLNNTTNFTLFKKDSSRLTPNFPAEKISEQFARHQALLFAIDIQFKPGQKYIQFPSGKVPFGSKYPTFSFNYTKGVPDLLNSQTNFDKWRFSMRDNMNFKLLGNFKYYAGVGGFINDKKVFIQDYQHFNGNLTVAAGEYVNSFQAISYYGNSTTAAFYAFGHVEHHFNGLLTNKIPLFRRLNWHLLAGSNAFYVNKTNHDIEVFAGLENIFKIFRVDVVAAYVNNAAPITAIRIGFGGVLGSSMQSGGGSSNRF